MNTENKQINQSIAQNHNEVIHLPGNLQGFMVAEKASNVGSFLVDAE